MPESADLASTLLAADAEERVRLVRSVDPTTLELALPRLSQRRDVAAAEVLSLIENLVDDRALRKAARRELHRLRSVGVHVPDEAPYAAPAANPRAAPPEIAAAEAWATDIDPSGARALWLLAERPLGGVWFGALLLNEAAGLEDLKLVETTRKRFLREFEAGRQGPGTWVSMPAEYALALVREAVDMARAHGGAPPPRYQSFRDVFGEAPAPPPRALIYDTISVVEIGMHPEWIEESAGLLGEPEMVWWHITAPPELRAPALEAARAPARTLLVPGHEPEQQARQLVVDTAQQALTPDVRHAWRRRLEETAYVFAQTDRPAAARRAAAAAYALEDTPTGPRVAPERHPLVRMLLAGGLVRLLGNETINGRRAGEILLELIERAESEPRAPGQLETRPSGLILPR